MYRSPCRWAAAWLVVFLLACESSREARLDEVRSRQAAGQFAPTLEPLRELLDETPDDPELNHLFGMALLLTRQPDLAIWPLRKAAQHPDRAVEDGLLLAQALLRGGSAEDAIPVLNRVLELSPDRLDTLRFLIEAKLAAKHNEEVLTDVERLLELAPDDPEALIARLVALLSLDRAEEAEEAFAAVAATMQTDESSGDWPPRICAATATFLIEKGDAAASETMWNDCLERFPAEEVIVFSALEFFADHGQSNRSIEILRAAHGEEPTHLNFVSALASRLGGRGETEEAERLLLAATHDGVNDVQGWFALAQYHESRDEIEQARDAMEQGLRLRTEAPPVQIAGFVDLLIRAGDLDRAEEMLNHFEGEPVLENLLRGRLLLARGKPEEAIEALETGLTLWPDNSVGRELVAEAAEQLGDYDRALAEYVEAVRNDEQNRGAVLGLLDLLEALGRGNEAAAILSLFLRKNPNDAEVLLRTVRVAGRANQRELADRAIETLSTMPSQRGALAAELAGNQAARFGPAAGADAIRRARLDLTRPANGTALRALVEYLVASGQPDEALTETKSAVAAHPEESLFHELHGYALLKSGAPVQAGKALERALELEPERAAALAEVAALTASQGDRASAIALYDRAYAAEPEQPDYAWQAIQLIAPSSDDAELDRRLEALVAKHGAHAAALNLLARRSLERDPERAFALAQRAVLLRGGPDALDTLGRAQFQRGEIQSAVQTLGRSVELRPDSPSTQYWLGRALSAAGDTEGARRALGVALETESFPEREATLMELSELGTG